jgi:hypothetical protein
LLGVMIRRHARLDRPSHPVGQLIAEEARQLRSERNGERLHGERRLHGEYAYQEPSSDFAPETAAKDHDQRLVDRLYRRYLLPRHATVEAYAECDTVSVDER